MITIALDAMGGDHGPGVVIPASFKALEQHENLQLILVGDQATLEKQLSKGKLKCHPRLSIHHASQVVGMDELPSQALRLKKDSSMRIAINLVKQGLAQACVSAGNTGALMATARFVLKTLPGIDRPAIVGLIPSANKYGYVRVLDLGANVDSHAEHLFQFAVMGSMQAAAVDNIEKPRVALLNIGEEAIKGNEQVKETARLLANTSAINYVGYVEGDDIFRDGADVIVCDGFVGNVALKTSEGAARFISQVLQRVFRRNWLSKMAGLIVKPVIGPLRKELDPALYNGASLLGLQGIVIKSHGGTTTLGFAQAINRAVAEIEHNVPHLISTQVLQLLEQSDLL